MPAPSPATSAEWPRVAETVSEVGRLERDGQRAEVHGLGQVLGVGLGQVAPRSRPGRSNEVKLRLGGLDDRAPSTRRRRARCRAAGGSSPRPPCPTASSRPARPGCSRPPTGRSGSASPGRWRWSARSSGSGRARSAAPPLALPLAARPGQQDGAVRVVRLLDAGRGVGRVLGVGRHVVRRVALDRAVGRDVQVGRRELRTTTCRAGSSRRPRRQDLGLRAPSGPPGGRRSTAPAGSTCAPSARSAAAPAGRW